MSPRKTEGRKWSGHIYKTIITIAEPVVSAINLVQPTLAVVKSLC